MAKTNMVEREKRRTQTVKKYAAKRARSRRPIRTPKTSPEERVAAQAKLQALPRDASPTPPAQSLRDHRPFARRVPQVRPGAHQDPRSREARRDSRPREGELVGAITMSMTDPIADLLTRIRNGQSAAQDRT